MQHYQIRTACGACKREFIIDIVSWGTPHQDVAAVTCKECAKPDAIMAEGEVKKIDLSTRSQEPLSEAEINEAMDGAAKAFRTNGSSAIK